MESAGSPCEKKASFRSSWTTLRPSPALARKAAESNTRGTARVILGHLSALAHCMQIASATYLRLDWTPANAVFQKWQEWTAQIIDLMSSSGPRADSASFCRTGRCRILSPAHSLLPRMSRKRSSCVQKWTAPLSSYPQTAVRSQRKRMVIISASSSFPATHSTDRTHKRQVGWTLPRYRTS